MLMPLAEIIPLQCRHTRAIYRNAPALCSSVLTTVKCCFPLSSTLVVKRELHDKGLVTTRLEQQFKKKDGLSDKYELIYRAPMPNYIKSCHVMVLGGTISFFGISALNYWSGELFSTVNDTYNNIAVHSENTPVFIIAFFLLNFCVYTFVSRYPLRIYSKDDGSYKSIFQGFFPWGTKTLNFRQGDVEYRNSFSVLPWKESQFKIGTKKVILLEDYFRKPIDLTRMLKE